ncbi:MAG: BatA domain-containing protein, partial [Planctomycetota bacterium]|nr:BatA domain-containing protein [Planctomycetota bacterium]
MTFTTPAWFWAMLLVAAAAVWAMFRPARKRTDVASLSLWQEALAGVPPAARRARRLSWSWLLLLAGAAAGVVALAGPVVRREAPARHVAIALRPSAELGGAPGLGELRRAAGALLDRLNGDDRVQLLLPAEAGGAGDWLSPAAARERIDHLELLWAPAGQLLLPPASADAQHTWIFTPAGAADPAGPSVTVIRLAAHLSPVTIDAVTAVPGGENSTRMFVAVRNQTDSPADVALHIRGRPAGTIIRLLSHTEIHVPAQSRVAVSREVSGETHGEPELRAEVFGAT